MNAGPHSDENRLNGINSSAWSSPVISQPEGKPYSTRIMRLFSNSRKGPVPAHSPTADSPTLTHDNNSSNGPQSWSGLPGLGVVDSFKKLKLSVLQGIQSRGAANHDGDHVPLPNQELINGTVQPGVSDASNRLVTSEGYNVSNGKFTGQKLPVMRQNSSDIEDYDDEEENDGDGLMRNSRLSRSIRRAYGAGRISLLDMGNGRQLGSKTNATASNTQNSDQTSKDNGQTLNINESTNVKVLSRLSKSAENLPIFKAPFRRKAPSLGPPSPQDEPQSTSTSKRNTNIQRTASASSVDFLGHAGSRRKSPTNTMGSMLKLVGSMTDLTVRHRRSPSPSPTSPSPMSPLSRLHDDYSRRAPCLQIGERQRRPSSATYQAVSVEHAPLVHHQSEYDNVSQQALQVTTNPLSSESPESTVQTSPGISAYYEPLAVPTTTDYKQMVESPLCQTEPPLQQEQTEGSSLPNEVR